MACKEIKPVNPKRKKSVLNIHWKDWCWSWSSTWCEELTHLRRLWCWERLKAGGEGDDRGWDGWVASLTQWTWVWASSRSLWWTGKPGVLQSMCKELDMTEWLDLTELNWNPKPYVLFSWLVWPEDWLCPMESAQHCAKTEWIKCVVSRIWRKYGKILKAHIKHRPCSLAEKLWQT